MRKLTEVGSLVVVAIGVLVAQALAESTIVTIPIGNVTARDSARGSFYAVTLDLPKEVTTNNLDRVQVEFAADVDRSSAGETVATAMVGLFPLTETLGDARLGLAAAQYDSAAASVRPVKMGQNRLVKLDVTETVRGWLAEPSSNHGIVIGTLTGPAVGTVSLRDSSLAPSTALRVTYYYKTRFGGRVSGK